ncbi:MAG: hypothetical protein IKD00_02255 [Candidatus Methanomethylophilaceae archaeon]|nr:hypothetical protein [Candidatus Methanomethylophilaceae archaeon]
MASDGRVHLPGGAGVDIRIVGNRKTRRVKRLMELVEQARDEYVSNNEGSLIAEVRMMADDKGGIIATCDDCIFPISGYCEQSVRDSIKPNQTWRCIIDERPGRTIELIPYMMVDSGKPPTTPRDSKECVTETGTVDGTEGDQYALELEKLDRENGELREINRNLQRSYNLSKNEMRDHLETIEGLKDENKRLRRARESLATQVQILNRKNSTSIIEGLETERDQLRKELEALKASMGFAGSENRMEGVRKTPVVEMVLLTGPTGIHSSLLKDGRYKVRLNPGRRCLALVEAEDGETVCRNNGIHIPGLRSFSGYEKIRPLTHHRAKDGLIIEMS